MVTFARDAQRTWSNLGVGWDDATIGGVRNINAMVGKTRKQSALVVVAPPVGALMGIAFLGALGIGRAVRSRRRRDLVQRASRRLHPKVRRFPAPLRGVGDGRGGAGVGGTPHARDTARAPDAASRHGPARWPGLPSRTRVASGRSRAIGRCAGPQEMSHAGVLTNHVSSTFVTPWPS